MLLFAFFPRYRGEMWWASVCMLPIGFTESMFVPEYWSPPSLFDPAARTGFEYVRLALREEREARAEFGDAYIRYAARTPAFFPDSRGPTHA